MPKKTTATTSDSKVRSSRPIEPMFLAPEYADACLSAFSAYEDYLLFGEKPEMALNIDASTFDSRPYRMSGSTAVIPVHGLLLHRIDWHWPGFLTGYDYITGLLEHAEGDDSVDRIVFDMNSGGGMVAGAFEAAEAINKCSKPTLAVVDNSSYSACYLLASACDRIVLPETGGVGSIGVITMHADYSKMYEEYGIEITLLYAGEYKADGNPYEKLSEGARERIMSRIEQSYDLFVRTVAEYRGMDPLKVRETKAGLFQGKAGVLSGLADAVENPRRAIEAFNNDEQIGSDDQDEELDMTTQSNVPAADKQQSAGTTNTPDQDQANTNTQETEQATQAAATGESQQAADTSESKPNGSDQARSEERARISAITRCEEAEGRSDLANHLAYDTDMSADQAKAILAAAPKAEAKPQAATKTNPFAAAMSESENPEVGADDNGEDEGQEADAATSILRDFGCATGVKLQ